MNGGMPDGSDPGRVERYSDRQVERVRRCVREPNRSDILKTIRRGRRGNIPSPKPNQRTKPPWSKATVLNNARTLRILAGQVQELDEAEYEGTTWKGCEGRDAYLDRLLDCSPEQLTGLITEMSIEREWARSNERDYCLTALNHFLAHDMVEIATSIDYPQVGLENAAVDIETVPRVRSCCDSSTARGFATRPLYTVLWESGCRVTALTSLKIKHWTPKGDVLLYRVRRSVPRQTRTHLVRAAGAVPTQREPAVDRDRPPPFRRPCGHRARGGGHSPVRPRRPIQLGDQTIRRRRIYHLTTERY